MSNSATQRRSVKPDPSDILSQRAIKKPGPSSRVNEEDEFSAGRLAKAILLTVLSLALIIGFFYHVSVVIDKTYYGHYGSLLETVFVGLLGLVFNASISVKLVRYLNKILFLKEDEILEKKFI